MRGSTLKCLPLATALALMLMVPASAAALTIGANLNRPANVGYDCTVRPAADFNGNRAFFFSGASTCTYSPAGSFANFAESGAAPGGGAIATQVRVRVGPVTGPMQAVVLRQTGSDNVGFTCCENVAQSRVFVPGTNGVTRVTVRLPMRSDIEPQFGLTTQDFIGLSILAPGVPIPAFDTGNGDAGNFSNPLSKTFFPHIRPGNRLEEGGAIGVIPLINAEVTRICQAGVGRRGSSRATGCTHALELGAGRHRGGVVRLPAACNVPIRCRGTLRLQSRTDSRAFDAKLNPKRKIKTWATGRFSIGAADKGPVKMKLTKAGKRKLGGKHATKVWANMRLRTDAGTARSTQRTKVKG